MELFRFECSHFRLFSSITINLASNSTIVFCYNPVNLVNFTSEKRARKLIKNAEDIDVEDRDVIDQVHNTAGNNNPKK